MFCSQCYSWFTHGIHFILYSSCHSNDQYYIIPTIGCHTVHIDHDFNSRKKKKTTMKLALCMIHRTNVLQTKLHLSFPDYHILFMRRCPQNMAHKDSIQKQQF